MGGSPDIPAPVAPPPPLSPIDASILERRRRSRRKRGTGNPQTLLTGPQGLTQRGIISFPTLLGGGITGAAGGGGGRV